MRYLLYLLLGLLVSCATPVGKTVKVCDGSPKKCYGRGHGAIAGSHTVVTAYHVVDNSIERQGVQAHVSRFYEQLKYRHWHPMKIREMILSPGNKEPIVIMDIDGDKYLWCRNDIYDVGEGEPYKTITGRGEFLWSEYVPTRGDSGSPVLNEEGYLIGVIYGGQIGKAGTGIMLRIDKKFVD